MRLLVLILTIASSFPALSKPNEPREISGLLMDASCQVIAKGAGATGETAMVTVREKYRDCKVTTESKSFAIHSEGRLHVVDETGNEMIRQQMRNEAFRASMTDKTGNPKWLTVTVRGVLEGDRLKIESVRR